jgi:hypothetical protein
MRTMRRLFRIGLLGLALSGCMTWHNPKMEPAPLLDQRRPNAVQVERRDRAKVVVFRPVISGDSLLGSTSRRRPLAIPLSDVSSISVMRLNPGLSALGLMTLGGFMALMAAASNFTILGS